MKFESAAEFQKLVESLKSLGYAQVDDAAFQIAVDAGAAALAAGWMDVSLVPAPLKAVSLEIARPRYGRPPHVVRLEVRGVDDAQVVDVTRGISVAWDKNTLDNVQASLRSFLDSAKDSEP